jgi:hypothetical protein
MANNYSTGCIYLAENVLPGRDKILKSWKTMSKLPDPDRVFDLDEQNGFGGLDITAAADGGLYISSGDEWLNDQLFCKLIGLYLKNGWISLDYVGMAAAATCSKLRPYEFGGYFLAVHKDGREVGFCTDRLYELTFDELLKLP